MNPKIALIYNENHTIHHIHQKGYVESPVRIKSILKKIEKLSFFEKVKPKHFTKEHITSVHEKKFYNYLMNLIETLPENKSLYPYVFPIRNKTKLPTEKDIKVGYYCIDTFTPINKNAIMAARIAVNCGLTGAELLIKKERRIAYALVRPPGHHAESNAFGGFCYFNTNAICANYLSKEGKVAILDIDYHHGNGQQEIFYKRDDVLTVSLHGNPRFAYPYFSGFAEEKGEEKGFGFNINYPLKEKTTFEEYKQMLHKAIRKIKEFKPAYIVIALGLDTEKNDPTGTFDFNKDNFFEMGRIISSLNLPTLVIQEGGYDTKALGINASHFFSGLHIK